MKLQFDLDDFDSLESPRVESAPFSSWAGRYFSRSDLSAVSRVIFVPLRWKTAQAGVLVVSASPLLDHSDDLANTLLAGVGMGLGENILQGRKSLGHDLKVRILNPDSGVPSGLNIKVGEMAQSVANLYLGALPGSLEIDLLSILLGFSRPYEPVLDKSSHTLHFLTLPDKIDDAELLLKNLLLELEEALGLANGPLAGTLGRFVHT